MLTPAEIARLRRVQSKWLESLREELPGLEVDDSDRDEETPSLRPVRRPAGGVIVRELAPPHREALLPTVLHIFDVGWLRELGDITVRDDAVMANGVIVAMIEMRGWGRTP